MELPSSQLITLCVHSQGNNLMQFTPNCFSHADPVIKVTKFSRLHLFWNYLISIEVMNLIIPGLILCVCVSVFCLSVFVFHYKTIKLHHQSMSWSRLPLFLSSWFLVLNSFRSWSTKCGAGRKWVSLRLGKGNLRAALLVKMLLGKSTLFSPSQGLLFY